MGYFDRAPSDPILFDNPPAVPETPKGSIKGNFMLIQRPFANGNIHKNLASKSPNLQTGSKLVASIRITWVFGQVEQMHLDFQMTKTINDEET